MDSMTKFEKKNPKKLDVSRIKRISQGCGTQITDVRELLKHHKQTKKMMGMFSDPSALAGMGDMENMEEDPQAMMKMMKKMGGNKMFKKMMNKKRGK